MFFKPEKCDLFIDFNFSISYTPNCTVSSYNFEKISGEGLTEPPPQTPLRFFSGFALGSGFALSSRALRALDSGFALEFAPPKEANLKPSLAEPP